MVVFLVAGFAFDVVLYSGFEVVASGDDNNGIGVVFVAGDDDDVDRLQLIYERIQNEGFR